MRSLRAPEYLGAGHDETRSFAAVRHQSATVGIARVLPPDIAIATAERQASGVASLIGWWLAQNQVFTPGEKLIGVERWEIRIPQLPDDIDGAGAGALEDHRTSKRKAALPRYRSERA